MLSFTNNYIPNRWGLTCLCDKLNWQMFSSIMVSASRCENTSPWWHRLCPLKLLNTSAPQQARTYGTWLQHQGLVECETSNVRKSQKSLNVWEVKNMRAAGEEEKALIISECWQCTDVSSRTPPPPTSPHQWLLQQLPLQQRVQKERRSFSLRADLLYEKQKHVLFFLYSRKVLRQTL